MIPLLHCTVVSVNDVPLGDVRHGHERHRPVVLVVHDERLVADCLAAVLSRAGFAPMVAYDGQTALELALDVPPELLISDVGISQINGVHLAMAVVHQAPDCKVLLFCGYDENEDLLLAYRAGYDFCSLEKPVHPADILQRVLSCFSTGAAADAVTALVQ